MELPEEPPPGGSLTKLLIEGNISEDSWNMEDSYFQEFFFSVGLSLRYYTLYALFIDEL